MKKILESDLQYEFKKYWINVADELSKRIKAYIDIEIGDDIFINHDNIVIRINIEKFNYRLRFEFPYDIKYKQPDFNVVEALMQSIQYRLYNEVFKR